MVAVLLALALQDYDAIVQRLGSEDVAVREAATAEISKLTVEALPSLRKFTHHPDAEVRARLESAIKAIESVDRLSRLGPGPHRRSLDLDDVPVTEAIGKSLQPFGVQATLSEPLFENRNPRISLHLKDATLWETYDALCTTGKVSISGGIGGSGGKWYFSPIARSNHHVADVGLARVIAVPGVYGTRDDRHGDVLVSLRFWLPPQTQINSCEFGEVGVVDDQDRRLEFTFEREFGVRNVSRLIVYGDIVEGCQPWMNFRRRSLDDAKDLRIAGTLKLTLPGDIEKTKKQERIEVPFVIPGIPVPSVP